MEVLQLRNPESVGVLLAISGVGVLLSVVRDEWGTDSPSMRGVAEENAVGSFVPFDAICGAGGGAVKGGASTSPKVRTNSGRDDGGGALAANAVDTFVWTQFATKQISSSTFHSHGAPVGTFVVYTKKSGHCCSSVIARHI